MNQETQDQVDDILSKIERLITLNPNIYLLLDKKDNGQLVLTTGIYEWDDGSLHFEAETM